MLKTLMHAVVVLAVLVAALFALSAVFTPKYNAPENGMIDAVAFGILGEAPNSIDVLIIGDSEAAASFSPLQMWNERGFTSYVCSTHKQLLPYSFTFLRSAAEKQRPRVVVLETNAVFEPVSIGEAFKREAKNLFPVLEYHDRWKHLTLEDFTQAPQATWTDEKKGFNISSAVLEADDRHHMRRSSHRQDIPRINEWYLQQIIDYCESIGATPILISTPSTKNWNSERHNGMTAWAEEHGVDYIDFNEEPTTVDIRWETESRDGGDHLNYDGAVKLSYSCGRALDEKYNLPDHRTETAYASWHDAYGRYQELLPKEEAPQ